MTVSAVAAGPADLHHQLPKGAAYRLLLERSRPRNANSRLERLQPTADGNARPPWDQWAASYAIHRTHPIASTRSRLDRDLDPSSSSHLLPRRLRENARCGDWFGFPGRGFDAYCHRRRLASSSLIA
jgi:hypothetical protein